MAYDIARGVTVLFGGFEFAGYLDDTWEWDGNSWIQRTVPGPSSRRGHGMAYDAAREVTVLFGGHEDRFLPEDTWEWDGTRWTLFSEIGPPGRAFAAMAYDGARAVAILFGGNFGPTYFDDTWELPNCPVDSDGDGVPDENDECDNSNLSLTVVIDGCDSGVANHLFEDGCTMADRIAACAEEAGNHGAFVGCVGELTKSRARDEIITPRDVGPIRRCAAHADLPEHGENKARQTKGPSTSRIEALSRP